MGSMGGPRAPGYPEGYSQNTIETSSDTSSNVSNQCYSDTVSIPLGP